MTRIAYKTKTGLEQFMPSMSEKTMDKFVMDHRNDGWCLACGELTTPVEPDARKYVHHDGCGLPKVYGIPELLMMGLVRMK